MSFIPSEEQQQVVINIKNGKNVIVSSVAGSGKSTTIIAVANALPDKKILQITYNSMLRKEFKEKIQSLGITNVEVHTYHSLAVKYFLKSSQTDSEIRKIMYNNIQSLTTIPKYDIVVLDETQDCTLLYYHFIVYFTKAMASLFQLLILGDYLQKIYEFKGADSRFLTQAEEIWTGFSLLKSQDFVNCSLHMSYRITNQMAKFVNNVMLGEERLKACRDGQNVMYIRNNRANIEKVVIYNIKKLLEEGTKPNEIFVLGGSVKGANSNIRKMENILVESDIPCLVPMFENDKMDERVIEGKVVFSTFHTVKGRQRKYVFVVGFDNSYLTYFARNIPRNICPNTLYVGCTRATEGLYLLEIDQYVTDKPLEFLKMSHLEMKNTDYIDFKGTPQSIFYEKSDKGDQDLIPTHHVTPTDLIKFIPENIIEEISPLLYKIFIKETTQAQENELDIPIIVKTKKGFYEDVSDLNGIAIPIMYYDYIHSSWKDVEVNMNELNVDDQDYNNDTNIPEEIQEDNILYKIIYANINEMKPNEHPFLKKVFKELSPICKTPSDYLYMANIYEAVHERLYFKLKQIEPDEYQWLTEDIVNKCKERLDMFLGVECQNEKPLIEKTIIHYNMEAEHMEIDKILEKSFNNDMKFRFSARTDIITQYSIWELKCTSCISIDHLLQVVIYSWLWYFINENNQEQQQKKSKILNIKTGEILRLDATIEELNIIMVALLRGKYGKQQIISDDDFIENCRKFL